MKYVFVVNPHAGETNAEQAIREAVSALPEAEDCEIYVTKGPGDATDFVKTYLDRHPDADVRFIACGGDGTVNEVFSGAATRPGVSVTCYPCGSGNDFVKAFGGAEKFRDIPALLRAGTQPLDLLKVGDRWANNVVNFGFDTTVAITINEERKKTGHGNKNAYTKGVVKALLTAMSFLGTPREAAGMYDLLRGRVGGVIPAEELGAAVLSSSDPADTLSDWMAWCVPSSLSSLWEGRSALIRQQIWEPELQLSDMKQQMLVKYLADEQGKYERLLFALRETYRSGALKLSDDGLYNSAGEKVDPSTLSKLNVTPTDSRIVFLLSPSGSQEISCQDMPTLEEVPKVDWRTASLDDAALVPDLGVVLTTGGNIPILLHRRADGTLVFREITQDLYISVLVEQGIPRIDMDTLPAPMTEYARSAGEGWTGAVLLPLGN